MFEHLVPFGGPVWTCLGRMLNFLEVAFGLEKDRQPFGKSLPLLMEIAEAKSPNQLILPSDASPRESATAVPEQSHLTTAVQREEVHFFWQGLYLSTSQTQ